MFNDAINPMTLSDLTPNEVQALANELRGHMTDSRNSSMTGYAGYRTVFTAWGFAPMTSAEAERNAWTVMQMAPAVEVVNDEPRLSDEEVARLEAARRESNRVAYASKNASKIAEVKRQIEKATRKNDTAAIAKLTAQIERLSR